jgi:hypothetical protein
MAHIRLATQRRVIGRTFRTVHNPAFAQQIMNRFERWQPTVKPPTLILRHILAPVSITVSPASEFYFLPRISLAFFANRERAQRNVDAPVRAGFDVNREITTHFLNRELRLTTITVFKTVSDSHHVERITERLVHRADGEALPEPVLQREDSMFSPRNSSAPPVMRIVRRPPAHTIQSSEQRSTQQTQAPAPMVNFTKQIEPRPTVPALDVHQLTDQVIQLIDRRIVAQRERLGRL